MAVLLDRIRMAAPPGAYLSLLADPPIRRVAAWISAMLTETAPASVGMASGRA
jgi:hypothetical protein